MAKFPSTIACVLLLISILNKSFSARNLGNPTPTHHHHKHSNFTFLMKNVLNSNSTHPSSQPAKAKGTSQLPFPKPLGFFPPDGGIPLPLSHPSPLDTGLSTQTQTLDVSNIGLFFPPTATLQELELGTLVIIDQDFFQHSVYGSQVLGKAQGLYVATSEDGTSHMMAMTATFTYAEFKDGLRFFGVHRNDGAESHIAVIGGTGLYEGANGYAAVEEVSGDSRREQKDKKFLLFNVYLS